MNENTVILVKYLKDCHDRGELATYEKMNELVKEDVQFKRRHWLQSAIDAVKRDYRIVFHCEIGQGYRPVKDEDVMRIRGEMRRSRVRSAIDAWTDEMQTVDTQKLSDSGFRQYVSDCTQLNLLAVAASPETRTSIEGKVKEVRSDNLLDWYKNVDPLALMGAVS